MTKNPTLLPSIPEILNKEFLLRLVAIESINHSTLSKTSFGNTTFNNIVELDVLVLEPKGKLNEISECIYRLHLRKVSRYFLEVFEEDERTLEFDTDEVTLKTEGTSGVYTLQFFNAYANLSISFKDIAITPVSK